MRLFMVDFDKIQVALDFISWHRPFDKVSSGYWTIKNKVLYSFTYARAFERGDVAWFLNGRLNACYNCVDRHLSKRADQVCVISGPKYSFNIHIRSRFCGKAMNRAILDL